MKRLLIVLAVFLSFVAHGQEFELTPQGFVDVAKPDNNYLVIEADGTQSELYKKVQLFVMKLYKDPKEVLSGVEPEVLTINGAQSNAIRRNSMHVFDLDYTLTIQFKDSKLRIDAPSVTMTTYNSNGKQKLHICWTKVSLGGANLGIYGKNGKLKSKKAKADLEKFFNAFVADLKTSLSKTQEDW